MEDNMKLIEVNGVKLEVDMRYAKKVEQYRVGDKIKVLIKKYNDTFSSHAGVIAGFDNFEQRPTIIVAYIENDYSGSKLHFVHINKDSKDIEICGANDFDLSYEKGDIVARFDNEINKKKDEIKDLETKKSYFIEKFSKHFEQ